MTALLDLLAGASILLGLFFFVAGTVGLLRFPDPHSRLHALTKADTLGLGFVALGAALHLGDLGLGAKLLLVWLLVLFAAAAIAQLVGRAALAETPVDVARSLPAEDV
ncbi:monovalent cation/H(+) antiporter subunit G [Aureimonas sp. SK2]|uniref:cation:proton antiporter n=1 Tax=Aureimonas sp. SK2 TaxID=3015992 RepID=UPI0024438A51|nr:monovalent cation/H(+) antiporter subunit G [Aureimonas sp. SK2]